jgi:hypothetical protein
MHYWHNQGEKQKTRFVSLQGSYHGETLGALAVTDIPLFSETYAPLLTQHYRVPSPDWTQAPEGMTAEAFARQQFNALEQLLIEKHSEICAVIVEPLIQGAAGMKMYHPVYLQLLRAACDKYGVHLIADEIAVGFAQAQGLLPNEQVLAQQARAAQMAQMAQMFGNPTQPTVGGYENMPTQPPFAPQGQPTWPPPTGYPTAPPGGFSPTPMMQYGQNMSAPPPSPGRTGFGGGPTSLDQVNSVANTAPLGDLKAMIEKLQAQGVR